MNFQFAGQLARAEADKYASQAGTYAVGSEKYADRYNGYFSGYMANAAERESLRAILKRIAVAEDFKEKTPIADKCISIDDLV